jgi:hypothetical protein
LNDSFFDFELFAAPDRHTALDKIRGSGQAGILAFYTFEEDGSKDREYLAAILKPKPLAFDLQKDVFFLALQKNEVISAAAIIQEHQPKFVLLFGCDPKNLGIRIQLTDYQPIKFQGTRFLKADSLYRIRTDRENNDNRRAGALWNALKEMFITVDG